MFNYRNLKIILLINVQNFFLSSISSQCSQQQAKRKKKKCRGIRKLQRFKAKLRKRGFDVQTITIFINNYNNHPNQQNNEEESTAINVNMEALLLPPAAAALQNQKTLEKHRNMDETKLSHKRKRESKLPTSITTSMSQMSISNLPNKRQHHSTAVDKYHRTQN